MSDYEILGVPENATKEQIRQAYHAAAKKLHPDVNDAPNASAMFRLVQEAYQRLESGNPRLDERPAPPVRTQAPAAQTVRRAPPCTFKQRLAAWVLAALRFVLMSPVLLVVNLAYVLCVLVTAVGGTLMLAVSGLCGIFTLIALFDQIWYSFFTFLILTWLCSPIGVPALAAIVVGGLSVLREYCWCIATGQHF